MADTLERLRALLDGRYRIEREIGRGGMATVFLAEDLKHHRPVAIKVLEPDLAGMLGAERFLREIETAARLQHPHILPLLDSGAEQGLFFYVMPFVAGESLRARLKAKGQLGQDEAAKIAGDVARALDYAHRSGIVHRDIKPENVLLADGHGMVADFGIARAIAAAGGENLTQTGMTLGSPPYMSPEQIAGRADVDGRSDIYSLGCMLYEMLAGQPPFSGPLETLAHQHMNLAPRSVRDLRPGIAPELAGVVGKALEKSPADRYATGNELAAALAVASGTQRQPAVAGSSSPAATRKPAAPTRRVPSWAWAVIAVLALAIVGIGTLFRSQLFHGKQGATAANRRWVWLADFEGPASDPSIAPAARDLVAAALDASRMFASVPAEQVHIALRNSGRPDSTRISPDLARELAVRSAIPVVVEGRITRLGNSYNVTLRATNPEDGRVLESSSGTASGERDLVPTLTRCAQHLRNSLGDRVETFQNGESWADVPTPSFEAFKLFRRGRELVDQNESGAARKFFRQAVAIDPAFAVAWTSLGTAYWNDGLGDSALAAHEEALRHPERLTPERRLDVQGKIAFHREDWAAGRDAFEALLALDPSPMLRSAALNNEALCLNELGQPERALELYRQSAAALPIAPTQLVLTNIQNQLVALNRLDEARAVNLQLKGWTRKLSDLEFALIDRSWSPADSMATVMMNTAEENSLPFFVGNVAHFAVRTVRGDASGAVRSMTALEQRAIADKTPEAAGVIWTLRADVEERLGDPPPEMPTAVRPTEWGIAALARRAALRGDSTTARRTMATWPTDAHVKSRHAAIEQVEAMLDASHARWDRVVERLRPVAVKGVRTGPTMDHIIRQPERWLLADAFEKLSEPDSAVRYLGLILEPIAYETPHSVTRGLWEPFVRMRLVRLYTQMGRIDAAQQQWQILSETTTQPDTKMLAMLDETRATLQNARGMGAGTRR